MYDESKSIRFLCLYVRNCDCDRDVRPELCRYRWWVLKKIVRAITIRCLGVFVAWFWLRVMWRFLRSGSKVAECTVKSATVILSVHLRCIYLIIIDLFPQICSGWCLLWVCKCKCFLYLVGYFIQSRSCDHLLPPNHGILLNSVYQESFVNRVLVSTFVL